MKYAVQWVRSLIFNVQMYVVMLPIAIIYLPWAIASPHGAIAACHAYCRWVRWTARWMIGMKTEVRGDVPTDEVLVAAKHQSFMDVIMIYGAVPRGKFIMKRILMYAPILGQYALRIGCIPVDRGKRGQAIKKMLTDVANGDAMPGQLIIYSQGTRIAPGVKAPYKVGTGVLYKEMAQDCVPVATNVGVLWPKRGVYREPGTAVVEFLPRIKAGLPQAQFMTQLEAAVEGRSDALMAEAGFDFAKGVEHADG
ncbi:MAG: 1-acyl-sn-glycerol-3-phosphate acyltransferase [Thalassobium sp.]|uniref:lysophospholipid acyltransferase family protein n=1 Tax=Octadecabacter sp. SW4 TaxID=2602067 RepID=UPI000C0ECD94|nr:lysophospholipid acyltransferase family protein [Octadecabacter sp. SW4]PHQ78175.1 MAG: 1-acyl-sn-glycerol-3-phosphate acyltransferase [Thalassobium sp.]QEE36773.1 1-acyl-sn-glycerol-3-phosphate acyltransferase [Octadecabacter sp. SW4]|tara:strand:+ start:1830 stop:2585 length:756 start_codon:yes stop_codon:yes gene_type:complete